MSLQQNRKILSFRSCYEYLDEFVFNLSAHQFHEKYRDWPGYVGVELEMLPVHLNSTDLYPPPLSSHNPVHGALQKLANEQGWELLRERSDFNHNDVMLMIKIKSGETISFEPGGQVEFSSQPFLCLDAAQGRLSEIQHLLEVALAKEHLGLLQVPIDPWHSTDEIGIQTPKKRYMAMDQYFRNIASKAGPQMMRQTCSIQVCLDFGRSDTSLVNRYLAAQLLAPFAAGIFAYSPFVEKKRGDFLSTRTSIWRDLDRGRTGFVGLDRIHRKRDRASCIETYLDFALSCPVVFVEQLGYFVPSKSISMNEWIERGINGIFPTLHDFIVHLSLLFPEVRPRAYMELRSVDCQARVWQIVPAAFYVGLLYDSQNLESALNLLLPTLAQVDQNMLAARLGLQSPALQTVSKKLMELAIEGLGRMPGNFCGEQAGRTLMAFYHRFTGQGRTPAEDLIDSVHKARRLCPSLQDYFRLQDEWQALIV